MVQTDTIRHEFAARLIQALNEANYPPHGRGVMLAQRMGVTSKAVSKWLTGESLPRAAMMKNIAKALNVDPLWLQHGDEATQREDRLMNTLFTTRCPLLRWEDIDDVNIPPKHQFDKVRYFYTGSVMAHHHGFWLIVNDDSMTSPVGTSVPEKSMILVDPRRTPENGQLVIAKLNNAKSATFKQFIVDEGTNRKYLKSLNRIYKPIEINGDCTFVGVVIESRMSFISPDPAEDTSFHQTHQG
ncbi:LexA family protein [Pantoea agglomerans]|uniref:LexA family protein n=1 Tax=Enterobacter agglomerans TaxID=549 RepID=UPI003DA14629